MTKAITFLVSLIDILLAQKNALLFERLPKAILKTV